MGDRARNRREQSRLEEEALGLLPHQRPNEPPRPRDALLDCPQSKYGVHRFVARNAEGNTTCEFCGRALQDWLDAKRRRP